jgi:hypothetical protein
MTEHLPPFNGGPTTPSMEWDFPTFLPERSAKPAGTPPPDQIGDQMGRWQKQSAGVATEPEVQLPGGYPGIDVRTVDRRTFLGRFVKGAVVFVGGPSVLRGDAPTSQAEEQTQITEVATNLTPEVLAGNGFRFLKPGGEPIIAPWGRTPPQGVAEIAEVYYPVQAQGGISANPKERNLLLGSVGALQIGLNIVDEVRIEGGWRKPLHEVDYEVNGGAQLYIADRNTSVAVKTAGINPLEYSLKPEDDGEGYLLTIVGGEEVEHHTQSAGIISFDGTPFPTPEVEVNKTVAYIAVLPQD